MISSNVVILTKEELKAIEDKAFQRGVERGKFEALTNAAKNAGIDDIYAIQYGSR